VGVGYPDKWKSYDGLKVAPDDAFGNAVRADEFHTAQEIAKLHRKPDRTEWSMPPQLVNAVNLPLQNALNFPAAILQPPFFDPKASDATNYGAIGAVIGHEISHSFDDQGAQFDAQGRLRDWWTKEDMEHFKTASASWWRSTTATSLSRPRHQRPADAVAKTWPTWPAWPRPTTPTAPRPAPRPTRRATASSSSALRTAGATRRAKLPSAAAS
jgi:hypothetical protein